MDCDNEAPRDPGTITSHPSFTDNDFEGHRAHTVYIGLHIPGYRRKGHHKRHRHHHHRRRDDATSVDYGQELHKPVTPPAERVHFILGEDEDGTHEPHPIFSEMEELYQDGEEMEWRETARWIKFEEDVEEGGNRWSKPHVATISLHSLFELRSCILNGTVLLDMDAYNLEQIADLVLENMISTGQLELKLKDNIKEALLRRHRHQHERRSEWGEKGSRLPLIRSLADIGRNSSKFGSYFSASSTTNSNEEIPENDSSSSLPANLIHNQTVNHSTVSDTTANSSDLLHRLNQGFMRKIPPGAEASNLLVGEVDLLERGIIAFVRLSQACYLGDLTEVPIPTRFLFILLGPPGNTGRYHEIGRAMATIMSDEVFHDVAYKAKSRLDLLAGVDEFLDAVTVLPPGAWDPNIRIEPPSQLVSQEGRKKPEPKEIKVESDEEIEREENGLKRSGRFFGGLINDVNRKMPWYLSDFKDGIALQCIASIFFLYFACLTPIITFGGLLGKATKQRIAAMESLLSGVICGVLYGLFSGQPLTILGSTGPVLVFESILFDICWDYHLDYLSLRLWIGLWTAVILLAFVAFDASALVCYITRFTEEIFATLISLIFIYKAFENVLHIGNHYPLKRHHTLPVCQCLQNYSDANKYSVLNISIQNKEDCQYHNGTTVPYDCEYSQSFFVPDIFLLSVILFMGTFALTILLREVKVTPFFPTKIRTVIADFAVVISIISMTMVDAYIGLSTPKLEVPEEFKPTWPERGWLIPFFGKNPWWTSVAAFFPAILATILIFMDQQITAVIINRKENKLMKGCGYHLDLFVLAILIAICSVLGLPWFVAATVLAMTHVNSLKMESQCSAPGEKPQFLGVREQRISHICIFILVGLSVFFTPILKLIPMPVLYGVFLFMGVTSLKGSQFFDRILIMLMPQKYQPDYTFLRHVPTNRVHIFTAIQIACFVILWIVKSYKPISIIFPVMLVVIIGVRKLLDFAFSQRELKMLDDIMPESTKRKREDKQKEAELIKNDEHMITRSSDFAMANGNVIKVPVDKVKEDNQSVINISEQLMKSSVWRSIDQQSQKSPPFHKKFHLSAPSKKKKNRGSKKDAMNDEEKRRLSIMEEEEENVGGNDSENQLQLHLDSDIEIFKELKTNETPV